MCIRDSIESEPVLLGIGLGELQLNAADLLRGAVSLEIEFQIVAVAQLSQLSQFLAIGGDQAAHHPHIAGNPLELGAVLVDVVERLLGCLLYTSRCV